MKSFLFQACFFFYMLTPVIVVTVNLPAANRAFMSSNGISHIEVERSIRLLALCSLGAQQSVLPYATIASALKVSVQSL